MIAAERARKLREQKLRAARRAVDQGRVVVSGTDSDGQPWSRERVVERLTHRLDNGSLDARF
jgi:hypothetical protein